MQKIMAVVLSLAIILGNVGGMGVPVAKAATPGQLVVCVYDQNNDPVEGQYLILNHIEYSDDYYIDDAYETDKSGKTTFPLDKLLDVPKSEELTFTLGLDEYYKPAYAYKTQTIHFVLKYDEGSRYEAPFVETVNGVPYEKDYVNLYVKDNTSTAPEATEATKKALSDAIAKGNKLVEADYNPDSWKAYQAVIKEAEKAAENPYATEELCQNMINAISEAQKGLEKVLVTEKTKSELSTAVQDATNYQKDNYTEVSWAEYEAAIANGQSLLDKIEKGEATEAECKAAINAITAAIEKLEVKTTPKIISVTAQSSPVNGDAENITLMVKGENLSDKLYYKRGYLKGNDLNNTVMYAVDQGNLIEIEATGTEKEKSITIPLPGVEKYPDATAWKINVGLSATDANVVSTEAISITAAAATKTALEAAMNTDGLNEEDYTTETWKAYTDEISKAQALINDPNALNADCNAAMKAIEAAKGKLVRKDAVTEETLKSLNAVIAEVYSLTETDYTAESWKAYNDAIEAAQILADNPEKTTKDACEAAIKAINDAKAALVKKDVVKEETKKSLETAVAESAGLAEKDYTAESWKAYTDAVAAAKALKADATETEYQAAIKAIADAKAALKKAEKEETPVNQDVKVSKIAVSGISKKIAAGRKVQLAAKVTPANATNKAVKWTTSNKKYATVNSKGKVTTKKAGIGKTVKITAAAKDGSGMKAVYKIKIMKNAVKKISLKAKKSVKAGKKVTVKATVKTTGKKVNKALKWTTSNKKYATVNSKGKVTTKKAGKGKTVKITARATDGSNKKATVKIKIK